MQLTWMHDSTALSWPLAFEQKVELFYEQTIGWQLHIAELVANGGTAYGDPGNREGSVIKAVRHSGFAVLQICLSYFETIGRHTGATGKNSDAFKAGVREVFPELASYEAGEVEAFLTELYGGARCGLYHNVRTTRVGLGFSGESSMFFNLATGRVGINPHKLPSRLKDHLAAYCERLKNSENAALRSAFEARFDLDTGAA